MASGSSVWQQRRRRRPRALSALLPALPACTSSSFPSPAPPTNPGPKRVAAGRWAESVTPAARPARGTCVPCTTGLAFGVFGLSPPLHPPHPTPPGRGTAGHATCGGLGSSGRGHHTSCRVCAVCADRAASEQPRQPLLCNSPGNITKGRTALEDARPERAAVGWACRAGCYTLCGRLAAQAGQPRVPVTSPPLPTPHAPPRPAGLAARRLPGCSPIRVPSNLWRATPQATTEPPVRQSMSASSC